MRAFVYRARDAQGRALSGRRVGSTAQEVILALQTEGYVVTDIRERPRLWPGFRRRRKRSEADELARFCRQLSALIGSYVPLPRALQVLERQTSDRWWRRRIEQVRTAVETGIPLSEALRREGGAFPELVVAMVVAGERAGLFEETLALCADHYEMEAAVSRKIRSALFYPLMVAAMCILVVMVMTSFVLPVFQQVLTSFNAEIPLSSRLVFGLGSALQKGWPAAIAAVAVAALAVRRARQTPAGRLRLYRWIMRVPVVGEVVRQGASARFCRVLGHLLGTDMTITEALDVAARTARNPVLEEGVARARRHIEQGTDIATPLEEMGFLGPVILQMIRVGEETGTLPEMLHRAASYTEREIEDMTERLTTLLEPVLILAVSGFVAFIVFSTLLPIFSTFRLIRTGV